MKIANLALAFLLELCLLAAFAYWGFRTGMGLGMQLLLGIGAPLLAAVVWGIFVAPRSLVKLAPLLRLVFVVTIFGLAVVALAAAGQPALAWALGVVFAINRVLIYV
jgi:hypothetical protein